MVAGPLCDGYEFFSHYRLSSISIVQHKKEPMSVGHLMLLGALLGFAMLGIFHKVADHPTCRPRAIALTLFFWASIFTGVYTLLRDPNGLHFPFKVLLIGGAGGLFCAVAIFTFQSGLK